MVGIYKITNPSGKVYIGQSVNIKGRLKQYERCKSMNNIGPKIFYSLRKYGWKNHTVQILEECTTDQLNAKEVYWKNLHLMTVGWQNVLFCELHDNSTGPKNQETKEKISATMKGRSAVTPKKAVSKYTKSGNLIEEFDSQQKAAESVGVKASAAICECCQGKRKTYKGFVWKYKIN
jgi:hypothetical protein